MRHEWHPVCIPRHPRPGRRAQDQQERPQLYPLFHARRRRRLAQWLGALAFDPEAIVIADRFVRGACVYVEGRLSTNEWTGQDGEKRLGLSVMSWHCRLAQIGRQKVKSGATKASVAAEQVYHSPRSGPAGRLPGSGDFDDPIPFAPEVR